MVSRDFEALAVRRAARARDLAKEHPAAREGLLFFARISRLQGRLWRRLHALEFLASPGDEALAHLADASAEFRALVESVGPPALREASLTLDGARCKDALRNWLDGRDSVSPHSFFARVLLQPALFQRAGRGDEGDPPSEVSRSPGRCPRCGQPPQAGRLSSRGDGKQLQWTCCLCLGEWPTPRSLCPACGRGGSRRISHYSAAGMELLQVQACEPCKIYLHVVDASRDPAAIADVDELTALPLDVWARGQGYRKLQPNLLGI